MGKKRGPDKGEGGRPKVEIDWGMFELLIAHMHPIEECCALLKVGRSTLSAAIKRHYGETFSTVYARFSPLMKASLRRRALVRAMVSDRVLIHQVKVHLGQIPRLDANDGDDGEPGVMEVPLISNDVDWEKAAKAQQAKKTNG